FLPIHTLGFSDCICSLLFVMLLHHRITPYSTANETGNHDPSPVHPHAGRAAGDEKCRAVPAEPQAELSRDPHPQLHRDSPRKLDVSVASRRVAVGFLFRLRKEPDYPFAGDPLRLSTLRSEGHWHYRVLHDDH